MISGNKPILILYMWKENYRLLSDENDGFSNEVDIISFMIDAHDVLELVQDIAKDGFNPAEPLVIIEKGKKQIVVEGNRRLTALKLLTDPSLKALNKVKLPALTSSDKNHLSQIPAVLAKSKDDALQFIVERHMGVSLKRWTVEQSRRIVSDLYQRGFSEEEISAIIKKNGGDTRRALREVNTIKYFKHLCLAAGYKPSQLTTDTYALIYFLQRQSESLKKSTRNLLNINYNADHEIILEQIGEIKDRKDQLQRLAEGFLIRQINKKPKYDTRTSRDLILKEIGFFSKPVPNDVGSSSSQINNEGNTYKLDDRQPEVSNLKSSLKPPRKNTSKVLDEPFKEAVADVNSENAALLNHQAKSKKTHKPIKSLKELKCRIKNDPAAKYLQELKNISIGKTPIASALLTRALVEACLLYYFDNRKIELQNKRLDYLLERFIEKIDADIRLEQRQREHLKSFMISYKNRHKDFVDKSIHSNSFVNLTDRTVFLLIDELILFFDVFLNEQIYSQ